MQIFWVLPSLAESRQHAALSGEPGGSTGHQYLRQVAQVVEQLGFDGIKIPAGRSCEDALVVAAALAVINKDLRLMVGVRPAILGPSVCARMASTLHDVSNGRLLLHIVSHLRGDYFSNKPAHSLVTKIPEVSDNYVSQWLMAYATELARLQDEAHIHEPRYTYLHPLRNPHPAILCGGESPVEATLSAELADLHIMPARPLDDTARHIALVCQQASRMKRDIRFALRLHIVVRDTDDAARLAARDILDQNTKVTSFTSRRFRCEKMIASENLWVAASLERDGTDAVLVGEPTSVAARLLEYSQLGIDTVVLSGYPHLEEMRRVAHSVLPLLRAAARSNARPGSAGTLRTRVA
jgi:alkanesulfonate monooxygenase